MTRASPWKRLLESKWEFRDPCLNTTFFNACLLLQ